eukprot:gene18185-21699_t
MKRIVAVNGKKELGTFIDFPHELYKQDPNYVPELFIAQRDLLSPGKHPFFKHSSLQTFLAYDGDKVVGRIAAIQNNNHNTINGANDGFFGFFDCYNDQETADLLLNTAAKWLKDKKLDSMIGPVNFSTNEICALLIQGFDGPPVAMMPYNKPYYLQLLETAGFHKKVKNFNKEAEAIREVYNKAWDKNTGFVPMTPDEFDYTAKDLKMILDPDFCLLAEQEGKIVGFALAVPDINQVLIKIRRG